MDVICFNCKIQGPTVFITTYLSIISKDFLVKPTNIKYLFLLLYSFSFTLSTFLV